MDLRTIIDSSGTVVDPVTLASSPTANDGGVAVSEDGNFHDGPHATEDSEKERLPKQKKASKAVNELQWSKVSSQNSCDGCTRRRVKCVQRGDACERCARMSLPCTYRREILKRGPKPKARSTEEVEREREALFDEVRNAEKTVWQEKRARQYGRVQRKVRSSGRRQTRSSSPAEEYAEPAGQELPATYYLGEVEGPAYYSAEGEGQTYFEAPTYCQPEVEPPASATLQFPPMRMLPPPTPLEPPWRSPMDSGFSNDYFSSTHVKPSQQQQWEPSQQDDYFQRPPLDPNVFGPTLRLPGRRHFEQPAGNVQSFGPTLPIISPGAFSDQGTWPDFDRNSRDV